MPISAECICYQDFYWRQDFLHFNKFYSKHLCTEQENFTCQLLNNGPSAGQTMQLHYFKSLVLPIFLALKNAFNIDT